MSMVALMIIRSHYSFKFLMVILVHERGGVLGNIEVQSSDECEATVSSSLFVESE